DGGGKIVRVLPERRLGFEWLVGFNRGHEYMNPVFYRNDDVRPRTTKLYEPDVQTDHLIEFLDSSRHDDSRRPFLAMVAYGPPHPPLVAPPEYLAMHSPEEVPVRANTPGDRDTQGRARDFLAKYYGLTVNIDLNVGRVLDWLDEAGLAEDTIVLFVSDHGDMAGEHGRFGKSVHHDASMRVPLIVRWPERLAGGRTAPQLVDAAVDVMPTLLELCGLDVPDCVQGVSFAPLLDGADEPVRGAVWYQLIGEADGPERVDVPRRGVRTLEWLYVRTAEGPEALHDLRSDPLEMDNLIGSDDHAGVLASLDGMLSDHMRDVGDDWSARAPFPPPGFVSHEDGHEAYLETLKGAILED
ncbi:MAG: sulfatase/phosphatase domain-containing protein, partial [Planctomycetota bacterium]